MVSRLDLQTKLEQILGSRNVYFQPPSNVLLTYPCIIYAKAGVTMKDANDSHYLQKNRYKITVIDRDPDSEIANRIVDGFRYSTITNYFVKENLNHTSLDLNY